MRVEQQTGEVTVRSHVCSLSSFSLNVFTRKEAWTTGKYLWSQNKNYPIADIERWDELETPILYFIDLNNLRELHGCKQHSISSTLTFGKLRVGFTAIPIKLVKYLQTYDILMSLGSNLGLICEGGGGQKAWLGLDSVVPSTTLSREPSCRPSMDFNSAKLSSTLPSSCREKQVRWQVSSRSISTW